MSIYRVKIYPHTHSAKSKGLVSGPSIEPVGVYHPYNHNQCYHVVEVCSDSREEAFQMLHKAFCPQDQRPLSGFSYLKLVKERYYEGDPETRTVTVTNKGKRHALPLRLDLVNHSPCGFCWGYGGSGPSQLALAICADLFSEEKALDLHQILKEKLITRLPIDNAFTIREAEIKSALGAN